MQLRDWLKSSSFSIKSFAEEVKVERAMIYRYFTGAIPRAHTIRRIEVLTNGAVRAQDFYDNAVEIGAGELTIQSETLAAQQSLETRGFHSPAIGRPAARALGRFPSAETDHEA